MQMKTQVTMRQVITQTFKYEGFFGFYKGMGPPFVTVPLVNSIVFAAYEFCKVMMNVKSESEFTFNQSLYAGMFAGLVNSVIVSPMELVKCRLQLQRESSATAYYKGPIDCVRKMIAEEGVLSLNNGMVSTVLREVPCYAG